MSFPNPGTRAKQRQRTIRKHYRVDGDYQPMKANDFYGTRLRGQREQDHDPGCQLMNRIVEVVMQQLQAARQRLMECTNMRALQKY